MVDEVKDDELLSADEIFAADDLGYEDVPVPEWSKDPENPRKVRLKALSAGECINFVETIESAKRTASVRIVLLCAINKNGERLFKNDQLQKLMAKSIHPFNTLAKVALRLNGLTERADEVVKND